MSATWVNVVLDMSYNAFLLKCLIPIPICYVFEEESNASLIGALSESITTSRTEEEFNVH